MQRVISAGGVVFRKKDGKIEILVIKDSYGRNAFPKGHVEKGETIEQAAIRETAEEVNLSDLKSIKKLGAINFWYTYQGERIYKTIHYFLVESLDSNAEPEASREIQGCYWLPLDKLNELETYKDLKPIISKTIKSLFQIKNL